jgi:hypothetical protein
MKNLKLLFALIVIVLFSTTSCKKESNDTSKTHRISKIVYVDGESTDSLTISFAYPDSKTVVVSLGKDETLNEKTILRKNDSDQLIEIEDKIFGDTTMTLLAHIVYSGSMAYYIFNDNNPSTNDTVISYKLNPDGYPELSIAGSNNPSIYDTTYMDWKNGNLVSITNKATLFEIHYTYDNSVNPLNFSKFQTGVIDYMNSFALPFHNANVILDCIVESTVLVKTLSTEYDSEGRIKLRTVQFPDANIIRHYRYEYE